LMRARLVAAGIALMVLAQSAAYALWIGVPDFPQIIQEADICVYGRITSARVLQEGVDRGHGGYECVAELLVDHVVFGPCKEHERIAVFYGEGVIDETVLAPAQSYVALLAKRPAPLKGYTSHALHLGVFHIPRDDTPVNIPEGLENPPKLREPTNFGELFEQIRYLRGPEVAIRPTKPTFRWDEPVTLEATFRNPCFETKMKLLFAPPPLAEYSYADQYLSAEGLPICDTGVPRPAEDPKPVAVVLAPHESTTRSVTVHPHFRERAKYDLASIAQIAVEYATDCVQEVEGAWTGSVFSASAPIRIVHDENAFTRKLADLSRRYAFTLGVHEKKLKPGQPARITVTAAYPASASRPEILVKSSFGSAGCRTLRQTDQCLAALAGQCEVTRDGRRIETAHEVPRDVRWLRTLLESDHPPTHGWTRLGVNLDLGKHFDLTQPGRYTVRLVVPREETGEARALASNLAEFEITAKEGGAAPAADTRAESASEKRLVQARELLKVLDKPHNSAMPRPAYYGLPRKLPPLMPEALDALVEKLESSRWDTRSDAQDLLAELGGVQHRDKIAKPLVRLLGDENRHVRSRSFYLLSKIGERRALGILIEMSAVRDATKFERKHVNSILCKLAGRRRAPRSWQAWWEEKRARYPRPPDDWQEVVKSVRKRWRHEAGAGKADEIPRQKAHSEKSVLERQIDEFAVRDGAQYPGRFHRIEEGRIHTVVAKLALQCHVNISLEVSQRTRAEYEGVPRFSMILRNVTVRDVLNCACELDHRYRWAVEGDFINVFPRKRDEHSVAGLEIDRCRIDNMALETVAGMERFADSIREMLRQPHQEPHDVRYCASKPFGYWPVGPSFKFRTPVGGPISVSSKGTLRHVMNDVVRSYGGGYWLLHYRTISLPAEESRDLDGNDLPKEQELVLCNWPRLRKVSTKELLERLGELTSRSSNPFYDKIMNNIEEELATRVRRDVVQFITAYRRFVGVPRLRHPRGVIMRCIQRIRRPEVSSFLMQGLRQLAKEQDPDPIAVQSFGNALAYEQPTPEALPLLRELAKKKHPTVRMAVQVYIRGLENYLRESKEDME